MAAISYKCVHCGQENWTEDSRAGSMRECGHCGKDSIVSVAIKTEVARSFLKACPYCAEKDLQPEAKVCKHCGKEIESAGSKESKATLITLFAVLVVIFGFVHVITGSNLPFPVFCLKSSFGFSETFINIDEITSMPFLGSKIKYPISVNVLQREGYIESDSQFRERLRNQ